MLLVQKKKILNTYENKQKKISKIRTKVFTDENTLLNYQPQNGPKHNKTGIKCY